MLAHKYSIQITYISHNDEMAAIFYENHVRHLQQTQNRIDVENP